METPLTRTFNPKDQAHVLWLKDLFRMTEVMKNSSNLLEMEKSLKAVNPETLLKSNPMKQKISQNDVMNFPMIHFSLAMIYTESVLKGEAWTPGTPSE